MLLGLDHPDQHGQHVDAIMNSVTSDRETLSTDDISGAQSMYAAPGPTPTPTPSPSGSHFANISTRMDVGTGNNVMIAGFIVSGSQSKTIIVRALGPTLGSYGVANALNDPMLELHDSSGATIATNDDWQTGSQASHISSSGYAPTNSNEPALIATLPAGAYTAIVRGYNNSTGVALVEVYELDTLSTRLSNISTRGQVGTDQNVLIGGLIINGSASKKLIVRAWVRRWPHRPFRSPARSPIQPWSCTTVPVICSRAMTTGVVAHRRRRSLPAVTSHQMPASLRLSRRSHTATILPLFAGLITAPVSRW